MIQLYSPGHSILHRLPAAAKLAFLAITAIAISVYPHDGWSIGIVLAVVNGLYFAGGFSARTLLREWWRLRWLVLLLAAALAIFVSPLHAWVNTGRVVSVLLLAGLLTLTTKMGDLLEVLQRLLRPLRRWGVDADAVAMTISLTITMIPVVAGFAGRVREAQAARGVRLGVRTVVPLLVMTMRHADDVGDALSARSLV